MKKPLKALMNIAHVNSDGTTRKLSKAEVKKFQTLLDKPIEPEKIAIDFLTDYLMSDREILRKYLLAQIINDRATTALIFRLMASRGSDRKKISKKEQKFKELFDAKKLDLSKHGKRIQEQCFGLGLDLGQTTIRKLKIKYD